jgi:hypothetical protein
VGGSGGMNGGEEEKFMRVADARLHIWMLSPTYSGGGV